MEENILPFTITEENREAIGFTNKTENLVIPEFFYWRRQGWNNQWATISSHKNWEKSICWDKRTNCSYAK